MPVWDCVFLYPVLIKHRTISFYLHRIALSLRPHLLSFFPCLFELLFLWIPVALPYFLLRVFADFLLCVYHQDIRHGISAVAIFLHTCLHGTSRLVSIRYREVMWTSYNLKFFASITSLLKSCFSFYSVLITSWKSAPFRYVIVHYSPSYFLFLLVCTIATFAFSNAPLSSGDCIFLAVDLPKNRTP